MDLLQQALDHQKDLNLTRSTLLLRMRNEWVPVEILTQMEREDTIRVANLVLDGGDWRPEFDALPFKEVQIAVAYLLYETWQEEGWKRSYKNSTFADDLITERTWAFMLTLDAGIAFLVIRNFKRTPGRSLLSLIQDHRITRNRTFMSVFLKVKAALQAEPVRLVDEYQVGGKPPIA